MNGTKISVGGRYLDEVKIRQTETSLLSFPSERHRADTKGDTVVLHVPALTVVQLFADGVLPPIGERSVEIGVHGESRRSMVLVEVRSGTRSAVGDLVSLTFSAASTGTR